VIEIVELTMTETVVVTSPGTAEFVAFPEPAIIEIIEVAEQGPPGPPGADGASTLRLIAGAALGGHRAVLLDADSQAQYASADDPDHFGRVVGITTGAAVSGAPVDVLRGGELVEPGWAWAPGLPVYLGINGVLTQVPPVAPSFCLIVGFPVAPTKLFVSLREPIKLT